MSVPNIKKMIGNPYKNPMGGILRDSDRDGVINVLDCRPYNSRKQGVVHDIRAKLAERRETSRKLREERREQEYVVTTKAEEAGNIEKIKQAEETARFKERRTAERKRKYIKEGGFVGMVSRGFEGISKTSPVITTRRKRIKVLGKSTKKGKKGKAKYRYVKSDLQPKKPQSLQEYMNTRFKGMF